MRHSEHWRACWWLLVATVLWGLSFPLIKTLWIVQETAVPKGSSLFFAALAGSVRFGVAAIVLVVAAGSSIRKLTRLEVEQGAGLAVFGGLGIVFQMDGLAHTSASTSAFLTQFYCLLIPMWAAWRDRLVPRAGVIVSSVMVLAGVALLAGIRWTDLRVGRGETETIIAAIFFAGQILWLERPQYSGNRVMAFTVVMFSGTALLLLPVAAVVAPAPRALYQAYANTSVWLVMGAIILFCTLGAYLLMNRWQRFVTATEAGLIYCVEPVAASLFATVLPGWLSRATGAEYANETVTSRLIVGGALITGANVLIQLEAMRHPKQKE